MRHFFAFSPAGVIAGVLGLAIGGAACGPTATTGTVTPPKPDASTGYASIDVEPQAATLTVTFGGTASQVYKVYGVSGNTKTDITTMCQLLVDPSLGTANGAIVTLLPQGGVATVTAACGAQTGTALLTLKLTGSVVLGMTTPTNAATLFAAATVGSDTTRLPSIEYPIDGAIAPLNIPPIEVQWTAAGNDLFHVSLSSTYASVDVYTTSVDAALAAANWDTLARSAVGGPLTIVVEGLLQGTPTMRYPAKGVKLNLSHDTIDKTAIYYWASSQGSIMTETFGDTTAPTVVKNDCTACHSVSRAGSRLGYSRCVGGDCSTLYAGFMKYDKTSMMWNEVVNADNEAIHGSYTVFAPLGNPFPDDSKAVAIVSMIDGTLALYDPDTGTAISSNLNTVANHGPNQPRSALMADWSPDGSSLVFASTPHADQNIDLSDGSIATMSYSYVNGVHTFGEPEFLFDTPITLPGGSYENFFFPSYSADGKLIVFDAARSSWRNFSVAASAGQRLMLADAKGAWVTDLTALNGGDIDNDVTWPHWAPGDTNDYYWIVFSSERDYGHEVTAANTAPSCVENGVQQCKQIWIGAVDKQKVAAGAPMVDPSAPPVWLPGQDTQADNISPYWTVPVTDIP